MDRMMHLNQHHQWSNQPDAGTANGTGTSASVSTVSQVAFVLAAVAFLSLFSSSLASSPLPSGAAISARLAALCGFVTTTKALFVLSNAIFLFLAFDCRCCFFSGACGVATPSTSDDVVIADSEMPSSTLQVQPCRLYCCSNTKGASADCSGEQGRREEAPVSSRSAGIEAEEATIVTLETGTCGGVAQEEVEKLEMDELNRKFEDFIQSRRIKWLREEEVLQCQQQQIV
uniref:DUF4408 domain-containing protein n=1 Tax=Aegilops tauschii TaxID=37682 RepID=M8BY06_AEGTA